MPSPITERRKWHKRLQSADVQAESKFSISHLAGTLGECGADAYVVTGNYSPAVDAPVAGIGANGIHALERECRRQSQTDLSV